MESNEAGTPLRQASTRQCLLTELDNLQRIQQARLQQLRVQVTQHFTQRLINCPYYDDSDPVHEVAKLITGNACAIFQVARASICHLEDGRSRPAVLSLLEQHPQPSPALVDAQPDAGSMQILLVRGILEIQDVLRASCGQAWRDGYLQPLNIGALLYVRVQLAGEMVALLRLEHTGGRRCWRPDEIEFAAELAEQYAHVLSIQEQRKTISILHLLLHTMGQSADALILLDRAGAVAYVNPSFSALTHYPSEALLGRRIGDLDTFANLGEQLLAPNSALNRDNHWQGEFKSRRKNLEPYWGRLSLSKIHADDGSLTHYLGIYEDITDSKQSRQRLERLVYKDHLTGLDNRYTFILELQNRFDQIPDPAICLLLVDIDNFKRINHSLGHQTGDKLLLSLARRLRNGLDGHVSLARFASNEFALLLNGDEPEKGLDFAKKVLSILEKPLFAGNQLISISGSIGLAFSPAHGKDCQTLMRHADQALHKAKSKGKQQLYVFDDELNAEASYKLFVENNLRRALMQNELEVFYQPKICLKTGQLLGMEALLRWKQSAATSINPGELISLAEETGLIIPIGKWVVRQACRVSKQLAAAGMSNLPVAVNLSPRQFIDQNLVESIIGILADEQLPAEMLELELTEGLLLEATDDVRDQLFRLKQLGLSLAMDDFGTGYSSLSYLKKFPIDILKIDRSFIRDIPQNQDDMEITSAVIAMAHKLKIKVVAEGIESLEQLDFLRSQNCDIGQGYLFSKPIGEADLLPILLGFPYSGSVATQP
jgi:diguanylate cyclase (GGDEF)-like protein/PAS domain S-box-containing protein